MKLFLQFLMSVYIGTHIFLAGIIILTAFNNQWAIKFFKEFMD